MKRKTLGTVLGLVIGLSGCGTSTESPQRHETAAQVQPSQDATQVQPGQENYTTISGVVKDVDEDSFGVYIVGHGGAGGFEYHFETLRVKSPEGKVYRLIHRGPSSHRIGDDVNFSVELLPSRRISYRDIMASKDWLHAQDGSIGVDGIIR